MDKHPLVSLITVCFNAEKYLISCLDSVTKQNYPNLEHIIIDGASTDGTLTIIKNYAALNKNIIWQSETDNGIYNAMNKGIKIANGKIIGFINADDFYYMSNSISNAIDFMQKNNNEIVHSNTFLQYHLNNIIYRKKHVLNFSNILNKMELSQNTSFWQREVFNKVGFFNENYRVVSDYDLVLKCLKKNISIGKSEEYWSVFRIGGISGTTCISDYENAKIFLSYNIFKSIKYYYLFLKCNLKNNFKRLSKYKYLEADLKNLGWQKIDERI